MEENRLLCRRPSAATVLSIAATFLGLTGCSVVMAAKQPPKKDLAVLNIGTSRGLVLAELGQPVTSETRDGGRVDVFSFTQGYSKPAKAGRALFHGAADVFTLGLWEVVGTPTEAVFDGTKRSFEVAYDERDRVLKVVDLQAENKIATTSATQAKNAQDQETPATAANTNFTPRSPEVDEPTQAER